MCYCRMSKMHRRWTQLLGWNQYKILIPYCLSRETNGVNEYHSTHICARYLLIGTSVTGKRGDVFRVPNTMPTMITPTMARITTTRVRYNFVRCCKHLDPCRHQLNNFLVGVHEELEVHTMRFSDG